MQNTSPKRILEITSAPGRHWVGNGFPVHGMFGYNGPGVARRSPFLAFALLISLLSLAGAPPLAGFLGKFFVFTCRIGFANIRLKPCIVKCHSRAC